MMSARRRWEVSGLSAAGLLTAFLLNVGCNGSLCPSGIVLDGCDSRQEDSLLIAAGLALLAQRPGPQSAYATSTGAGGNDVVSAFRVNETSGQLTEIAQYTVGSDPYDLTVDQTGRYLYVMNSASNTISQFRIDGTNGTLTEIASPLASVTTPFAGPTMLGGTQLYIPSGATANTLGRYSVASGGVLTFQENIAGPSAGNQVWFMRGTPDSRFLYATIYNAAQIAQYAVNSSSGTLTQLGTFTIATQTQPWSIEVESTGRFAYVANSGSATIGQYSINTNSGQLTAIGGGTIAAGTTPIGLAIHPGSRYLYAANNGTNTVSQYSINTTTGALSALSPAAVSSQGAYGLAIDKTGRFVYVCDSGAALLRQYAVQSDGTLTAMNPATVATGSQCRFIAVARAGG